MVSGAESDDTPRTYAPHDWFRDRDPVVIRFMPEYGVDVPLFPQSDDTDALVPEDLLAKLMRWQSEFDKNFHYEMGWKSTEVRDRWAAEAVPLEAELREALKGKADLVVDLWPLPWSGPRP
jgi:hypothetical protein